MDNTSPYLYGKVKKKNIIYIYIYVYMIPTISINQQI